MYLCIFVCAYRASDLFYFKFEQISECMMKLIDSSYLITELFQLNPVMAWKLKKWRYQLSFTKDVRGLALFLSFTV